MEVESFSSHPQIAFRSVALSSTSLVRGPIWSSEEANATRPYRETRPYVGFKPTIPQRDAGWRIDPPVSEPREQIAVPEATLTAGPPLEPPGTRAVSQGFLTLPK